MRAPTSIVFYGNFGAGNLGNEVTLQTVIEETRRWLPDARLLCVCTSPGDVQTRHGIAAVSSLSHEYHWAWSDLDTGRPRENRDALPPGGGTHERRGVMARLARLAGIMFGRVPREVAHWYRMLRLIARSDMLVVAGTGIVTDANCGSLSWPYEMFKLTILARLCGARVVFLSVGAGPFRYRLGCWFIKRSLSMAHYRSYRDVDSKQRLESIGFTATAHDPVYPDLVFGLAREHLAVQPPSTAPVRIVGLGLKDYAVPVNDADVQRYRTYLGVMADFVMWLQARGHTVRLIIGDAQYDTRVREDLIALLESRNAHAKAPLLLSDPVPTVDELLRQLRDTDAVVSPRFHNLVLGLMLNKPVIALSDLPKVTALLGDLGLGRYCLPLASLNSETLVSRFALLQSDREALKPYIRDAVQKYREAVSEQYGNIYGNLQRSFT